MKGPFLSFLVSDSPLIPTGTGACWPSTAPWSSPLSSGGWGSPDLKVTPFSKARRHRGPPWTSSFSLKLLPAGRTAPQWNLLKMGAPPAPQTPGQLADPTQVPDPRTLGHLADHPQVPDPQTPGQLADNPQVPGPRTPGQLADYPQVPDPWTLGQLEDHAQVPDPQTPGHLEDYPQVPDPRTPGQLEDHPQVPDQQTPGQLEDNPQVPGPRTLGGGWRWSQQLESGHPVTGPRLQAASALGRPHSWVSLGQAGEARSCSRLALPVQ